MTTPSGGWHYAVGQEQKGPFPVEHLKPLVVAGIFRPETLVWSPALPDWQPLWRTELAAALGLGGSAPPPFAAGAPAAAPFAAAAPSPGFLEAVRICFSQYATFQGRAGRPEFWYFVLFGVLMGLVGGVVDLAVLGIDSTLNPVSTIASLVLFLPALSVAVRRLHDTDRAGWWYWIILVPIVGIVVLVVFWCQAATAGRNRFG